jgi:hypothetical protein
MHFVGNLFRFISASSKSATTVPNNAGRARARAGVGHEKSGNVLAAFRESTSVDAFRIFVLV